MNDIQCTVKKLLFSINKQHIWDMLFNESKVMEIIIDNKFTKLMYNIDTPKSLEKLTNLINRVKTELQKSGVEITSNKTKILDEYGFYCDVSGLYSLFIGEWFYYWKETGNPFCIAIQTDNKLILKAFSIECNLQSLTSPKLFKDTNWLTSNIDLSNDENELNIETIAEKIKNVIEKMKSTTAQQ